MSRRRVARALVLTEWKRIKDADLKRIAKIAGAVATSNPNNMQVAFWVIKN